MGSFKSCFSSGGKILLYLWINMPVIQKIPTQTDAPQEANAIATAEQKMKQTINNLLYIVKVEENSKSNSFRFFATQKVDETSNMVGFKGFEIPSKDEAKLKTYSDILTYVEKKKIEMVEIKFPITRIISIENRTYKKVKS